MKTIRTLVAVCVLASLENGTDAFLPVGKSPHHPSRNILFGLGKSTSGIIIVHPTPPHTDKVADSTIKFLENFNTTDQDGSATKLGADEGKQKSKEDGPNASAPFHFGDFGPVREAVVHPETNPSWRSNDPKETLSDWVVQISRKSSGKTDTYHVHKYVLAVGERRSLYFAKMLKECKVYDHGTPKSTVELADEAADAFPVFLDYVYNVTNHKPAISTNNAVPLHYLARKFAAETLFNELNEFIRADMDYKTAPIYAAMAPLFDGEENILDAAIELCSEKFGKLNDATLAKVLPVVFEEIALKSNCDSLVLSKKLALYCKQNANRIDREFLLALTKPAIMTEIDVFSAVWLLKYALIHKLDTNRASGTSLASRCKDVVTDNWRTTLLSPDFDCLLQSTQLELMKCILPVAVDKATQADELDTELRKYQRLPNTFADSGYWIRGGRNGAKAFKAIHQYEDLYFKQSDGSAKPDDKVQPKGTLEKWIDSE